MTNITSRLMVKMCEYIANWVYKPTFKAKSNRSIAHPLPLKNEWRDSFHSGCWRGIYCGGMFKSTWKLITGGQHNFIFPMNIRKKEVRYFPYLVSGFNPSEKYESQLGCSKPPISYGWDQIRFSQILLIALPASAAWMLIPVWFQSSKVVQDLATTHRLA